jgi:hypothetical protein
MSEQETYVWTTIRDRAIRMFAGQTPRAADEEAIMTVFAEQPAMVERKILDVAQRFEQGTIRWPWSVVRSRVQTDSKASREVVVGSTEQTQAIAKAETRMRTVGLHLVTEEQVLDEFFGHGALLESWKDSDVLRERFLALWIELRPLGGEVDRAAEERGRRWAASRSLAKAKADGGMPEGGMPNPFLEEDELHARVAS